MQKYLVEKSTGDSFSPSADEQVSETFVKAMDGGFIEEVKPGECRLTEKGKEVIE